MRAVTSKPVPPPSSSWSRDKRRRGAASLARVGLILSGLPILMVIQFRSFWDVSTQRENSISAATITTYLIDVGKTKQRDKEENPVRPSFKPRNVSFLFDNVPPPHGYQSTDNYSGMWWTNLERFLSVDYQGIDNLEGFSFFPFGKAKGSVGLTRDWFDFCVEHYSIYHRTVPVQDNEPAFHSLLQKLVDYIQNVEPYPLVSNLAPNATIVTVPFVTGKEISRNPDHSFYSLQLKVHALAATLASLAQIGMGRAIVVGRNEMDGDAAQKAFDLLTSFMPNNNTKMQVQYIVGNVHTTGIPDTKLIPRQALHGLKKALTGQFNEPIRQLFLGSDPERWKYVYYTEPDLVLSSRPGSVPDLTTSLDKGMYLAAHRLFPLRHERDLPSLPNTTVIPAVGRFAYVTPVDTEDWVCCDGGNRYPGKEDFEKCGAWWQDCGYNKAVRSLDDLLVAHRRIIPYSLIRFKTGTNTVMMAATERARQCFPLPLDACPQP